MSTTNTSDDTPTWLIVFVIVAIVLSLVLVGISNYRTSAAHRACLKLGYPDVRSSWGGLGAIYCVKRVNQTDVVVPAP